MKKLKWKIIFPMFFLTLLFLAKFVLIDYVVSDGKRVGNLTKITKKGKVFKTWEGTIDEGYGENLTTHFSVKDEKLAQELYAYEGKQVILYYEEHFIGFPRDTKYNIVSWTPKDGVTGSQSVNVDQQLLQNVGTTLFCSMLGSLVSNKNLYDQVKNHLKVSNIYIFNQYQKCNE